MINRCSSGLALTCLTVALTPALAHAGASGKWESVGPATGTVSADGSRYAVWQTPDGSTTLYDARSQSTRTIATPDASSLIGTGGGFIAWQEPQTPQGQYPRATMHEISTGQTVPAAVPAADGVCAGTSIRYSGSVGSQGLSVSCTDRYTYSYSANWRTGLAAPAAATGLDDLDRPSLVREVCGPVKRASAPVKLGNTDSVVVPLWMEANVTLTYTPASTGRTEGDVWKSLRLQRCGSKSSTVLDRGPYVYSANLGTTQATWLQLRRAKAGWKARAVAYNLKTKQKTLWPASQTSSQRSAPVALPQLAAVSNAVFLSVPDTAARSYDIRIGRFGGK